MRGLAISTADGGCSACDETCATSHHVTHGTRVQGAALGPPAMGFAPHPHLGLYDDDEGGEDVMSLSDRNGPYATADNVHQAVRHVLGSLRGGHAGKARPHVAPASPIQGQLGCSRPREPGGGQRGCSRPGHRSQGGHLPPIRHRGDPPWPLPPPPFPPPDPGAAGLGLPDKLDLFSSRADDAAAVCNCLHALVRQRQV